MLTQTALLSRSTLNFLQLCECFHVSCGTLQYIAKHRPKVITTAEAMQQVEDEFVS